MTFLDLVLVAIWAGITLGGFFKGAVRIVFGLGGLALGIWISVVLGRDLAVWFRAFVDNEWLALGLAYLLPLVVVGLLCSLAGWGMEKSLEALKLGCLNRLLGGLLAGGVAAGVLAILLVTAVRISPEVAAIEERSALLARVQTAIGFAVEDREAAPQAPETQGDDAATSTDDEEETSAAEDSSGR